MALGTTLFVEGGSSVGPVWFDRITTVGDAAYAAGGTVGLLAKYRTLKGSPGANIIGIIPQDTAGYQVAYDHVNDKLKVYIGDNNNAADSPGVEVTAAADLSAVTFNLIVIAV